LYAASLVFGGTCAIAKSMTFANSAYLLFMIVEKLARKPCVVWRPLYPRR
jgi:hypothetical protein